MTREPAAAAVIWLTGLPASGKSTLADRVAEALEESGFPVQRLDGDVIRQASPGLGFSRRERDQHILRTGRLASEYEAGGAFVVASFVSPYAESRDIVRAMCRWFVEVYVSTPLAECERRDPKGLYARARRGELANFTGVNDPYEPPRSPEVTVDTSREAVEESVRRVLAALPQRKVTS